MWWLLMGTLNLDSMVKMSEAGSSLLSTFVVDVLTICLPWRWERPRERFWSQGGSHHVLSFIFCKWYNLLFLEFDRVSHKDQCGGGCTIYRLTRFIGYYVLSWPFTYVGASLGGNTGSFLDQLMKGLGVVGTPVYSLWIEGLSLSRLVYQVFPILPLALKILWRWLLKLRESWGISHDVRGRVFKRQSGELGYAFSS